MSETVEMRLLRYLKTISARREPLVLATAAEFIDSCPRAVGLALRRLGNATVLKYETARVGAQGTTIHRVTEPSDLATPWPETIPGRPRVPTAPRIETRIDIFAEREELIARKEAVEADREAHRRYWLAQERAPRRRPAPPSDFLDKATALALQGVRHG